MAKMVKVVKASGEKVPFDSSKLEHSLRRAGAGEHLIREILRHIDESLYDGISTREIYNRAFSLLKKASTASAARYKLKKAIMELGPSGYPFEKLIGAVLKKQGFKTRVGVLIKGQCVTHEVDVVAKKDGRQVMVECKFHNRPGLKCDVKVPLYIHSRFRDIEQRYRNENGRTVNFQQGMVVTNTRFTEDALQYGRCVGIRMIGWDFPVPGSLKQMIDLSGLHPVTSLTTLTGKQKEQLLNQGVVLCKDLLKDVQKLAAIGMMERDISKVSTEAEQLIRGVDLLEDDI